MPTVAQLKEAVAIAEAIEALQKELHALIGTAPSKATIPVVAAEKAPVRKSGKRWLSPEARERIAAAQRARWAGSKGTSKPDAKAPVTAKNRALSPEGRARIVAALKARWAMVRKRPRVKANAFKD